MRLDVYLVENKYFTSRAKAQAAIKNGDVKVNGLTGKASADVSENDNIIAVDNMKYVGRGGYKLEKAIFAFHTDFKDKIVLDIGASTGGFTDCSLQNGAMKVYSVDVGHGQLDETLVANKRVINLEGTDIRQLSLAEKCDIAVIDVSFISLEHILIHVSQMLTENGEIICLLKPQFELGKKRLKNGIVKDSADFIYVLEKFYKFCAENELGITDIIKSPIRGGDGNTEFLLHIKPKILCNAFNFKTIIKEQ